MILRIREFSELNELIDGFSEFNIWIDELTNFANLTNYTNYELINGVDVFGRLKELIQFALSS